MNLAASIPPYANRKALNNVKICKVVRKIIRHITKQPTRITTVSLEIQLRRPRNTFLIYIPLCVAHEIAS